MFKVSLRSVAACLILNNLISQNGLVVEQNKPKVGPQGYA